MSDSPDLPDPRPWPGPITAEQYRAFTPQKLELIDGYLLSGSETCQERVDLLALLLANCGLEEAVKLASPDDWREALERSYVLDW